MLARWITIAFALFSFVLGALELGGAVRPAALGITRDGSANERIGFHILSITPGSAAERAGLHVGEFVAFVDPREDVRKAPGSIVRLRRSDGSLQRIPIDTIPLTALQIVQFVPSMFFCVLGLAIALRAWGDVRARRLAWAFLWAVVEFATQFPTRWPAFDAALGILESLSVPLGMTALVVFCATWQRTPAPYTRAVRTTATVIAVAYAVAGLLSEIGIDPATSPAPAILGEIESLAWASLAGLALISLIVSFKRASGVDRQRIGWMLATFVVALGPLVIYEPLHSVVRDLYWPWVWYTASVLPFGLAYATLRHRVIDLGFALNRAAVFAATTLLIAGLFGGFQWVVNQLLSAQTKREGFVAQLAVAVLVLYVVGFARSRTEAFVAHAFFATRRRRIDAVLRIAAAVDTIDDPDDLAPLVTERMRDETGIAAAIVFDDAPAEIVPSTGMAAFPLRVRARDRGTLYCAPPDAEETFAPDERAVLERLAAAIAVAHALLDGDGASTARHATAAASAE